MLIYNTLTKKKEEFQPINAPEVKMYMCGPTVYDFFHIGNARSFLVSDVIRRFLIYKGYKVTFAMNITDIDDKIIKKANEEGIEAKDVSKKFSEAFLEDLEKFKVLKADIYPRATQHMGDIIRMIKRLVDKGSAYNVDGNVFYNVNSFDGYGKLSGKNTDDLISGARIEINDEKKNPLDFSLWKKAKENEPYWDSPWGKGRPGWHIECSAMSCKHLGNTFDIHAGGHDLIFPHHENEIAQSEAANGVDFVKYWLHFGFLNIQNEKMSKSTGNFFTAREVLKKYSAEAIRLFFVQTHYRGPINYSNQLLDAAQKGADKIKNLYFDLKEKLNNSSDVKIDFEFNKFYDNFSQSMEDDFNSPKATAVIFDFVRSANKIISTNEEIGKEFIENSLTFLEKTATDVLGILDINESVSDENSSIEEDLIQLLIQLRNEAKLNKNYALADQIRNSMTELGIELRDSKEGTTYKKIK